MLTTILLSGVLLAAVSTLAIVGETHTPHKDDTPKTIRLWEGEAPGAKGTEDRDIPTLTVYNPTAETRNGAAMIVCPGGGYGGLAPHEGKPIAEWLNTLGVTSYVLKYRLGPRYHHPVRDDDRRSPAPSDPARALPNRPRLAGKKR